MRVSRLTLLLSVSIGLPVALVSSTVGNSAAGAQPPVETRTVSMSERGTGLELTLGLRDSEPKDWTGSIAVAAGKLVSLVRLPEAEPIAAGRWQLSTRRAAAKKRKKQAAAGPVRPIQLRAMLDASATATVEVTTSQGRFSFAPGDLSYDSESFYLDGAVSVKQVPATRQLTRSATDDDFPAVALAPDGSVWCTFTAYDRGTPINADEVSNGSFDSLVPKGNGDKIRLMRYADGRWSAPVDVTAGRLDVWRPAVAVDDRGTVWVVWSQQVDGNWDLFARNYDPDKEVWSRVRQLTKNPGADAYVVAAPATGDTGAWIAWQGWRGDNFDVLLGRLSNDAPLTERRVSTSAGNDWHPAIAVGSKGEVWVAWDTYDQGNYDVFARRFHDGRLDDPTPVAVGTRFEARPSIVVDDAGRLWIAFEDADPNWGKDFGSRLIGKGVPFYLERNILVRCVSGGKVLKTKVPPRSELIVTHYDDKRYKPENRHRISFPRLGRDGRGNVWLLYRRHPLTTAGGERWISCATYYAGDRWAPEIRLPDSANLLDNRPALAPLQDGLLAVYSSDGRKSGARDAQIGNLHAAVLRRATPPDQPTLASISPDRDVPPEPVHPDESEEIRRMRDYRVTVGDKTYQLARGEFHRHTEISSHRDWDGPLEDVWRYAMDVADMDWIGPGDHDYGMGHDYMWWLAQKQIDLMHHAPSLVTMYTYERSIGYPSGHRNVMFTRRGIRPLPRLPGQGLLYGTPERGSPDIKNLYAFLKHFGGICSSHTSATNMGTDWRDHDSTVEPVVEIFQGHRQNYEETGAPLAARNPEDSIQGYKPAGFVWQAFAKGHRLGFQSSSDHVSTHISYGVVLVEERTREAILDAFKRRHCYAALDNIIMDVCCGEAVMGDEVALDEPPQLEVFVHATDPIARIDIIRQVGRETPVYVYNTTPNEPRVRFQWRDQAARLGQVSMYYVRIVQSDGRMAWASPIWVDYRKE